jgi:CBS domain-containing protein
MSLYAKDIMVKNFDKLHIDATVEEAIIKISNSMTRKTGYKTTSLMVIDDFNKLTGVISMFDILYHLRPDFLNFGIDGVGFKWDGQLKILIDKLKEKKVHQIMSYNVVSAKSDDHIMILLDGMVKNKYRRLPVLENDQLVGVVYISDIYHRLFTQKLT